MTALLVWGATTLLASSALLLLVLLIRLPLRRAIGPRLAYALWALPALRLLLPPLPADLFAGLPAAGLAAGGMSVLAIGRPAAPGAAAADTGDIAAWLALFWLAGALAVFAAFAIRHWRFCGALRAHGMDVGGIGNIRILAADVAGPLAFGVRNRFIAVPHGFASDYSAAERRLALAHETAHHDRGDLVANWASLLVLAVHWWNPLAWAAIGAFRDDQEVATDARVIAGRQPAEVALYGRVLAKAAGLGALPACNLNPRANLKGRLMMLARSPVSKSRRLAGAASLVLGGATLLAATMATAAAGDPTTGGQAVTIGVKPDGAGSFALIIGGRAVAPGAALPGGATLPADFSTGGGCDLKSGAKASAMVIKGSGGTTTYTVMCASAAPAPIRATLVEGLASLDTMRASVASQPASAVFPEAERRHALGAIDRSIAEVKATIAAIG